MLPYWFKDIVLIGSKPVNVNGTSTSAQSDSSSSSRTPIFLQVICSEIPLYLES